eukprot:2582829-Heterocapsa_arctica.AAC.1
MAVANLASNDLQRGGTMTKSVGSAPLTAHADNQTAHLSPRPEAALAIVKTARRHSAKVAASGMGGMPTISPSVGLILGE